MTSLYQLLQEVKPRRALFTSYTFSSVWFEAGPYPLLSREECQQITVLLDAREARQSVDNSTSRYGGSRYRVIATTPSGGGIFHPKIAYLEADAGDVLVVASANLTGMGQGYSLEVLDAVHATTAPQVFGQIADFFERLPLYLSLLSDGDRDVLAQFAARARTQAERFSTTSPGPQSVWLVTTLERSAGAQFVELAQKNLTSRQTLTVLSPFFDKDVRAVAHLRDKLEVDTVRYGLGRQGGILTAPFLENIKKTERPQIFVEPPGTERPLHAKWFELTGTEGHALVMTGSVNATWQSLWTTGNIEVSIARLFPASTTADWQAATEKPLYIPCDFPAPKATGDIVTCTARITRLNWLEVEFAGVTDADVNLALHHARKRHAPIPTRVDANGRAAVKVSEALQEELPDEALWVTARGVGFEVTTWVNIEPHLTVKPAQVDLFKAIGRVGTDNHDDDDAYLLFDTAHLLLTKTRLTGGKVGTGKAGTGAKECESGEDTLLSEAEWLAGQGEGTRRGTHASSQATRIFQAIGKLLEMDDEKLRKVLAMENEVDGEDNGDSEEEPPTGDDAGDVQESRRSRRKGRQRRLTLAEARDRVRFAIDARLAQPMPDALAILIVPQKIRDSLSKALHYELREVDLGQKSPAQPLATQFSSHLMGLLTAVAGRRLGSDATKNLLPLLATVGAIVALCLERRGFAVGYDQILALLETFAGRRLDTVECHAMLENEWRGGRLPRMRHFQMADLQGKANLIASASRMEERIEQAMRLAFAQPPLPITEEFSGLQPVVRALRETPGRLWKLYSVIVADEIPVKMGCPQCYAVLDSGELEKLKAVRMAVCKDRCQRPVFWRRTPEADFVFPREDQARVLRIPTKSAVSPRPEAIL